MSPQIKKEDYRTITGAQKAAIFMLSLGDEQSSRLFSMLEDDEIRGVSQAMANLGMISSNLVERIFIEFADQLSSSSSLVGSLESTERLLQKTLGKDRVDLIMEEIRGPAGKTMWDKLGNVSEAVLSNYLKNEYPQTVAVVLSKIRPDHAARVLVLLPDNFAIDVVMRMLRMEAVQKNILEGVERTLRTEFMSNLARSAKRDAHEMVAEIFNNLDLNAGTRFMSALEERNLESAERIKSLMFTFDDLVRIDPAGIQVLLRSVSKEILSTALKGATETIKELFFRNMSGRAAKMLRDDMEILGPVRLREVDRAQGEVVMIAKQLAESGQINVSEGRGDDEMVY